MRISDKSLAFLISFVLIAIGFFIGFFVGVEAANATEQKSIVFVVDVSSSVQSVEYGLQKRAYVDLLRDPEVQSNLDGAYVAIVEFATEAKLIIPWTDDYEAAATEYLRSSRFDAGGGQTNPYAGIRQAISLLISRPGGRTIDISGDGKYNVYIENQKLNDQDWWHTTKARLNGARIICNALIFGNPDERDPTKAFYQQEIVTGFIMEVGQDGDFAKALKRKIVMEIS